MMKKELDRFFGDKRMVASILLPGVLIYIAYCFMGSAMGNAFGVDERLISPQIRSSVSQMIIFPPTITPTRSQEKCALRRFRHFV